MIGSPGRVTRGTFDGSHKYTTVGQFKVGVTVTDDDRGTSVTRFMTLVTENPKPVIETLALDEPTINEGDTVTVTGSYADPSTADTHTVAIDWGDGETSDAAVNAVDRTFTAQHQYKDNAATTPSLFTIVATVRDSAGGIGTSNVQVTVNNAAPVVNAGADATSDEGSTVAFTGSFTDAGTLDTHTIAWDFGDGSTATGTLTPTHVFADNGKYTVKLTVTDKDGAFQSDTLVATIVNRNPTLVVPSAQTVDEGGTLT